jgi:hypothetical protein
MWFGKRIDPQSESRRNGDAVKSNDMEHVAPVIHFIPARFTPARHGCVADNQAPKEV